MKLYHLISSTGGSVGFSTSHISRAIPPGTVLTSGRDDAPLITFAKLFLFSAHEVTQGQYEQVMGG